MPLVSNYCTAASKQMAQLSRPSVMSNSAAAAATALATPIRRITYISPRRVSYIPAGNAITALYSSPHYEPDRISMIDPVTEDQLTFSQVRDAALRFATVMKEKYGIQRNDVVLLTTINSIYLASIHQAILALGAIVSPANVQYTPDELAHQIRSVKPKLVIASDIKYAKASLELANTSALIVSHDEVAKSIQELANKSSNVPKAEILQVDGTQQHAYYALSSGTSGLPKTVVLTHTNIAVNMLQWAEQNSCIDKKFTTAASVLPLSHLLGLQAYLWIGTYVATKTIVFKKYELQPLLRAIDKYQVESICVVPPIVLAFAKSPLISKYKLDSLRYFCCAAAPLSQSLIDQAESKLPNLKIEQIYGQSETSPLIIGAQDTIDNPDSKYKGTSIGSVAANTEIRLVDPDTMEDSQTDRGEVWVRGPQVMPGYLNNPDANASAFHEDWLRTGDIAIVDELGHFLIVDRIKELIKSKGLQVAPAELEGLLLKLPDVKDCAVIGVMDSEGVSEQPRAYTVLREGADPLKVVADFNSQVALHKRLWGGMVVLDQIPKSPSGKILRRILRDGAKTHEAVGGHLARNGKQQAANL